MPKSKPDEWVLIQSATSQASTNSYAAVSWSADHSIKGDATKLIYEAIAGTVYVEETGSTNGVTFRVKLNDSVISGEIAVAAGKKGNYKVTGNIGETLSVEIKSTVADSHGTAVASISGR